MNNHTTEALVRLGHALRAIQSARGGDRPWLSVDLTMAQFKAVLLLAASGGLPSRVLGRRLGIRPSAVTPLVDRLVAGSFVKRENDPADRRVVYVKPSRKALDLAQRLMETNRAVVAEVIDAVPARHRTDVQKAIGILLEAATRVLADRQEKHTG